MKLSNKTYDILKSMVSIWMPALATLILAVCKIWGLPYGEAIAGTITALATCIGTIIGISSRNYWEAVAYDERHGIPNSIDKDSK